MGEKRLINESCRGLEGWVTVCLELDEFVKYKHDSFKDDSQNLELALDSLEQKQQKNVNQWSLIPLTRAIDTLVITIKDKF